MKVLVIGAGGQDGRIISNLLSARGHQVFGVTRPLLGKGSTEKNIFNIDLSLSSLANEFLNRLEPDEIYHVAAIHGSSLLQENTISNFRDEIVKCNVHITENILKWLRRQGKGRLHVALSSQMYSALDDVTIISENSPPNPQNFYGTTKLEAWNLVREHRSTFGTYANASILFNHSSEYSSAKFLFPTLVTKLIENNFAEASSLGLANPNSRLDITDAVEICTAIIESIKRTPNEDYVLGSGRYILISDLVREVNKVFKPQAEVSIKESNFEVDIMPPFLLSDISKAKLHLGWVPQNSPVELLIRMISNRIREMASGD
jgi:GDPmannose 4,6-dehydratase